MTEHGEQSRIEADEARVALAGARWRARSRRVKLYRRVLPIVILAKSLAVILDHGTAALGAPSALGGRTRSR